MSQYSLSLKVLPHNNIFWFIFLFSNYFREINSHLINFTIYLVALRLFFFILLVLYCPNWNLWCFLFLIFTKRRRAFCLTSQLMATIHTTVYLKLRLWRFTVMVHHLLQQALIGSCICHKEGKPCLVSSVPRHWHLGIEVARRLDGETEAQTIPSTPRFPSC